MEEEITKYLSTYKQIQARELCSQALTLLYTPFVDKVRVLYQNACPQVKPDIPY
jgi:hypothetical protein